MTVRRYIARCRDSDCSLDMPFTTWEERDAWATRHVEEKFHPVILQTELRPW